MDKNKIYNMIEASLSMFVFSFFITAVIFCAGVAWVFNRLQIANILMFVGCIAIAALAVYVERRTLSRSVKY